MVRIEPVRAPDGVFPFAHAEVLEWNKTIKEKFVQFISTLGKFYVLADNPKLLKFCQTIGGQPLKTIQRGTIVRFNV